MIELVEIRLSLPKFLGKMVSIRRWRAYSTSKRYLATVGDAVRVAQLGVVPRVLDEAEALVF